MNNSPSSTSPNTGTGASSSGDEDTQLVERCVAGDSQAFEQLFVKHRQALFAVAWRLVHDEDAALDVVQDAFVKAYEELENLRGEARFYPWLRRIAVNLSIDRLRHIKRSREVSLYGTQTDEPEAREESAALAYASEEQTDSPECVV